MAEPLYTCVCFITMANHEQLLIDYVRMRFEQSRDYGLLAATFAVSRACQQLCLELVRKHAHLPDLVPRLSCEAQLQTISTRRRSVVLDMAGRTAASSDTKLAALVLLTTPNLPPEDARKAIEAGLRVSYDQFVLAARLRIPGSEVWPRAHRQEPVISSWGHYVAGNTNLLHSAAECICGSFEGAGAAVLQELLPRLSPQQLLKLLYIAVNVTDTPTCEASEFAYTMLRDGYRWLDWMHDIDIQQVSAESIHELLVTAITRRSFPAVDSLSYFPGARQLVSDTYTFTPGARYLVDLPDAQLVSKLASLFMNHLRYGKPVGRERPCLYEQQEAPFIFHHLCRVVCGSSACEAALLHVMLEVTKRCAWSWPRLHKASGHTVQATYGTAADRQPCLRTPASCRGDTLRCCCSVGFSSTRC